MEKSASSAASACPRAHRGPIRTWRRIWPARPNRPPRRRGSRWTPLPRWALACRGLSISNAACTCSRATRLAQRAIVSELQQYFTVPVRVGNDANCAVVGETVAGAAQGLANVLMLTLGTGVGGGLILDGRLFAGGDGMGAEAGACAAVLWRRAVQLRQHRVPRGVCVRHGPHPRDGGGHGAQPGIGHARLCARARRRGRAHGVLNVQSRATRRPAPVVDGYIEHLAAGIGGFVNVFRPDVVLIGGGLSNQGDALLVPLAERVRRYTYAADIIGQPPVRRAALGNDAGIYGAAYLGEL